MPKKASSRKAEKRSDSLECLHHPVRGPQSLHRHRPLFADPLTKVQKGVKVGFRVAHDVVQVPSVAKQLSPLVVDGHLGEAVGAAEKVGISGVGDSSTRLVAGLDVGGQSDCLQDRRDGAPSARRTLSRNLIT